eukprot:TRINITY_DN34366_c0_g1_i1.p1 TRINITY_DN34366_c0_g1~~TRINITY_DN34366_c0_g1_i1.p1  ORF type:complete len:139 (+),score=29.75 TRINITY_DN34366_c0_g1_i1:85-501(+)
MASLARKGNTKAFDSALKNLDRIMDGMRNRVAGCETENTELEARCKEIDEEIERIRKRENKLKAQLQKKLDKRAALQAQLEEYQGQMGGVSGDLQKLLDQARRASAKATQNANKPLSAPVVRRRLQSATGRQLTSSGN